MLSCIARFLRKFSLSRVKGSLIAFNDPRGQLKGHSLCAVSVLLNQNELALIG